MRILAACCLLLLCGFRGGLTVTGLPTSAPVLTPTTLVGSSPAVSGAQLTFQGAAKSVPSSSPLTSCAITAGDPSGNFTATASGSACVLKVSSAGAANLTGTSGSVSQTLTITGTNGNGTSTGVSVPVTVWADGSTGAPACTIPNPTLLAGEATRAPWNVAGVDYCVGLPSSVTVADPVPSGTLASALTAVGCSGTTTISCTGANCNNATIQGFDFSLHGGLELSIGTCSGLTVKNNNFEVGTNGLAPIRLGTSAQNITIEFNTINGNGVNNTIGVGLLEDNSFGNELVQWNIFENAFAEHMVFGNSPNGNSNHVIQFNYTSNAGLGQPSGAHGDWSQIVSSTANGPGLTSATFVFNTDLQTNTGISGVGSQGFSFNGNDGFSFLNDIMTNNTVIAQAGSGVNTFFNADFSWLTGTGLVSNNFVDFTGNSEGVNQWVTIVSGTGPNPNTFTGSGNINMVTGAPMPAEGTIN